MITIHMIVAGADRASRWYQDTFGAVERSRIELADGRLIHVELSLSGSALMLADEFPEHHALSPAATGEISATLYLAVEDVDTVWQRALTGGAVVVRDLADTFWGEREGQITDPFGHRWGLTQHLRDVPIEEMTQMAADFFAS
jgi:PhnB protein